MTNQPGESSTQQRLNTYHAVRALKQEHGLSDADVVAHFVGRGVSQDAAAQNLTFYYAVERERLGRNARRDVIGGIMIGVAGLVLRTVHEPLQAAPAVVQWFMPVVGALLLAYGLWSVWRVLRARPRL